MRLLWSYFDSSCVRGTLELIKEMKAKYLIVKYIFGLHVEDYGICLQIVLTYVIGKLSLVMMIWGVYTLSHNSC